MNQGVCYINGEHQELGAAYDGAVLTICDNEWPSRARLQSWLREPTLIEAMNAWLDCVYWHFQNQLPRSRNSALLQVAFMPNK